MSSPPTTCLAGYQVQGTTGAAASRSSDSPGRKAPFPPRGVLSEGLADSPTPGRLLQRREEGRDLGMLEGGRNRPAEEAMRGMLVAFHGNLLIFGGFIVEHKTAGLERGCALERPRGQGFLRWGWRRQGERFPPGWWALFSFFTSS